jgi:hypothetical protein
MFRQLYSLDSSGNYEWSLWHYTPDLTILREQRSPLWRACIIPLTQSRATVITKSTQRRWLIVLFSTMVTLLRIRELKEETQRGKDNSTSKCELSTSQIRQSDLIPYLIEATSRKYEDASGAVDFPSKFLGNLAHCRPIDKTTNTTNQCRTCSARHRTPCARSPIKSSIRRLPGKVIST